MRKRLVFVITLAMVISLTGCVNQELPIEEPESRPVMGETADAALVNQTDDEVSMTEREAMEPALEPSAPAEINPTQVIEEAESTTVSSNPSKPNVSAPQQKEQTATTVESSKTEKPKQTAPNLKEESEPSTSSSTSSTISEPQEAEPPKQKPEAFNINYWIQYAQSYAQSMGLQLEPSAVDCWDTPIAANAKCLYLERDIQSRIRLYASMEGITDDWVWAEKISENSYELYIGYA